MGDDEMDYWLAYHQIHNIAPDHQDALAALIAWACTQPWSKDKLQVDQFMLKWDSEEVRLGNKAAIKAWVESLKATNKPQSNLPQAKHYSPKTK